jgi:hypothetical protein
MKFSLSKLKTAFGNQNSKDKKQLDNFIEEIIKTIEQKPFASSDQNVCYVAANELAGYYFLQTIIVGKFKIKTFNGAQLTVKGDGFQLELESDMKELVSDLYAVPKSYVTRIDFILNKKDLPKIDKSRIHSLILSAKKQSIAFSLTQTIDEEEE